MLEKQFQRSVPSKLNSKMAVDSMFFLHTLVKTEIFSWRGNYLKINSFGAICIKCINFFWRVFCNFWGAWPTPVPLLVPPVHISYFACEYFSSFIMPWNLFKVNVFFLRISKENVHIRSYLYVDNWHCILRT